MCSLSQFTGTEMFLLSDLATLLTILLLAIDVILACSLGLLYLIDGLVLIVTLLTGHGMMLTRQPEH
jgi:hypothetical protein